MPLLKQKVCFRPSAAAGENLPFSVRSTGYYKVQPPFIGNDKTTAYVELFWCAHGEGCIEFGRRQRILKQNQIALYYPNMRHYWHAYQQNWEFYWLTIDGPLATALTVAFGMDTDVYHAGTVPVDLFEKLQKLVGDAAKQAELRACAIAFHILTLAAGSHADPTDELVNAMIRRMHERYALSTLNVKTLASEFGIGRVALTERFHAAMGTTPGAYLERLRLQNALALLKQKRLKIAEVALRCGYPDANYFSRVIRRTTGRSPMQFRKYSSSNFDSDVWSEAGKMSAEKRLWAGARKKVQKCSELSFPTAV
ncbi:MAG: AraC family transcriptional regulator [Verrucomicrobiae bacterium]|nr:AraC family transcriptional regulator [Verrucomicrobiae bacterium]